MKYLQRGITIFANLIFAVVVCLVIAAVVRPRESGEAYFGSFEAEDLNRGWRLSTDVQTEGITLPIVVEDVKEKTVAIT